MFEITKLCIIHHIFAKNNILQNSATAPIGYGGKFDGNLWHFSEFTSKNF